MIDRRNFIKAGAAATLAVPFATLALAKVEPGVFELRAQKASISLAGVKYGASNLWLYNGETPGPEIRVSQGDRVRVRFTNELDEPTSIHWHGIRIENAMDGVAGLTQDPVQPGDSFDYDFIVPDAGTFWYHAHKKSWEQVARGLYGPLIVDESEPSFDRDHDITLTIDDWRLGRDGTLQLASLGAFMDWTHAGRLGNWVTTNGKSQPEFELKTGENYRIRLINASNARILQISPKKMGARVLGFDGFVFDEVGDSPERLVLTPAQRVDLLISASSVGDKAMTEVGDFALEELSGRNALHIAKFKFVESSGDLAKPVILRPNNVKLPDLANAKRMPLVMAGGAMGRLGKIVFEGKELNNDDIERTKQVWTFNGVANLAKAPFFSIERGETVIIETENQTGWLHGMHVHGHHFQVVSLNGNELEEKHWRDTFIIDRKETVGIAFVADNPGKWLFHCHMLEHAAAGMTTWFEVT